MRVHSRTLVWALRAFLASTGAFLIVVVDAVLSSP
ncbi:hypothetical protein Cfla_2751 [Cellulomonas flavigena DSM 20109]|uniref:Uncharacterized protein n=1 Tax=Cellulomonas flavigena (strain ATCC 482 / DSM 20109 / BCRC 11376 / JCM 18109 / NBRC 3775 / NCIMB 8073 / NRS 134) TaxID=446466 RepID=D5UJJ9_CELFN|nr:hypothetical protein Cfla_2751 [Cellulomonas flavigena DSM 20109]